MQYTNGNAYDGQFAENKRHGRGKLEFFVSLFFLGGGAVGGLIPYEINIL